MNLSSQPNIESRLKVALLITYALHNMLSNLSLGFALLLAYCLREAFGSVHKNIGLSELTAPRLIHEALHLSMTLLEFPQTRSYTIILYFPLSIFFFQEIFRPSYKRQGTWEEEVRTKEIP